jgi:hemerythrin-like domain-containing protein
MKSIESLMNEHRVIEHGLVLLERIINGLNSGERIPADIIRILIRFFREFADKYHHGKEEDSLFPLLESRGIPRIGGPIGVMLIEH